MTENRKQEIATIIIKKEILNTKIPPPDEMSKWANEKARIYGIDPGEYVEFFRVALKEAVVEADKDLEKFQNWQTKSIGFVENKKTDKPE